MSKYKELDDLLSSGPIDESWYEYDIDLAEDIMKDFSKADWEKLSKEALNKEFEWQYKLLYRLGDQGIQEEIELIIRLFFNTTNDELKSMCIDSLRCSFNNELGHEYVKKYPEIIAEAKRQIEISDSFTEGAMEEFLKIFSDF